VGPEYWRADAHLLVGFVAGLTYGESRFACTVRNCLEAIVPLRQLFVNTARLLAVSYECVTCRRCMPIGRPFQARPRQPGSADLHPATHFSFTARVCPHDEVSTPS
jgi:hypothetical protein